MKRFEVKTEKYIFSCIYTEGTKQWEIIISPTELHNEVRGTLYSPPNWAPTRVMQFIDSFETVN